MYMSHFIGNLALTFLFVSSQLDVIGISENCFLQLL